MDAILPALEAVNKLYLSGPFGAGKTTAALARVRWLLRQERTRGDDILIIVPQRTLGQPYYDALRSADMPSGPLPTVTTLAGLARETVQLYWPLLAQEGGFQDPEREPVFLTLETSQYHMAPFVDAALASGDFDGVRVERSRVISQVLDNLNKAALHGFSIQETYERLELAVPPGEQQTARLNALRAARRISDAFRAHCLAQTLIDFSLQIDLFSRQVLVNQWSRTHLFRSRRHLIADNLEEDTYAAHQLIHAWLPHLDSALLVSDEDAGFRLFLGADAQGVNALAAACDQQITLDQTHVKSPQMDALDWRIDRALRGRRAVAQARPQPTEDAMQGALANLVTPEAEFRFYPQMLDWIVEAVRQEVEDQGTPPGAIAVLAPFVSDALRFSLQSRLAEHGIDCTTHRPSRALQDDPAARALVTLALLAHPDWGIRPATSDVTLALTLAIDALDPVRAHLLSQVIFPPRRSVVTMTPFEQLAPEMQARITYRAGEMYDGLRAWLAAYRADAELLPLDQFFARIFGEVLSQPGYGFHMDYDAARTANQLVVSAKNFRWALEGTVPAAGDDALDWRVRLGREYVDLFESGALGALYVPGWRVPEDAVFLAPAYTFLMRNQPVDVQFWIDIGSAGWWERLYQPLTHPYVLSRRWPRHDLWTDADEFRTRQEAMRRLLLGLVRRTRRCVYLAMSSYSESGFEQSGPLMGVINRVLVQGDQAQERIEPAPYPTAADVAAQTGQK